MMTSILLLTTLVWAEESDNPAEPTPETSAESTETTETSASTTDTAAKPKMEDKPKEPKEAKAKKEKPVKEPSDNSTAGFNPHLIIGMETGAALSTTELKASFLPQWQFGVQFPYWNDRLGVVFQGVYHVSKMEGSSQDDNMTAGSYTYSIRQQEGEVGMNLRVRIPEVPVVTPEIWIGPTVQLLQTTLDGKSGSKLPTSVEQDTRIGLHAALLGEYELPVGYVIGGVHYTTYQFTTQIQGDVRNHAISPTVGYRYRFF
jgi:hypothetical protein